MASQATCSAPGIPADLGESERIHQRAALSKAKMIFPLSTRLTEMLVRAILVILLLAGLVFSDATAEAATGGAGLSSHPYSVRPMEIPAEPSSCNGVLRISGNSHTDFQRTTGHGCEGLELALSDSWLPVGDGLNGHVWALTTDHRGNLYAGGYFSRAGSLVVNYVARWDGSNWSSLGTGMNNAVLALATDDDGNLYAGGWFTQAGGASANYIARWDGSSWSPLGSGMNTYVRALATNGNGYVYAGGGFEEAGGASAPHVARWDGITWSDLGGGLPDTVMALRTDDTGNLCAGGQFSGVLCWDGSGWSSLGSMSMYVSALTQDEADHLYAAGFGVMRWDLATQSWENIGSVTQGGVNALAVDGTGNLYAGGGFPQIGAVSALRVARWDGVAWSPLGSGLGSNLPESVIGLAAVGDRLYAGGTFLTSGGNPLRHIAMWRIAWTPTAWRWLPLIVHNTP